MRHDLRRDGKDCASIGAGQRLAIRLSEDRGRGYGSRSTKAVDTAQPTPLAAGSPTHDRVAPRWDGCGTASCNLSAAQGGEFR